MEIALSLRAGVIFIQADDFPEVAQFVGDGQPHGKIHDVVVEERNSRLQTVCHAQLVLHHQQPMHEGLGFKVQRVVDVILRPGELPGMAGKNIPENIAGLYVGHAVPDRLEHFTDLVAGDQPLPVGVVFVDIGVEIGIDRSTVIAPRVAAKQLIPPAAREADFNKLPGKLRRVKIRVALPHPRFFEVLDELLRYREAVPDVVIEEKDIRVDTYRATGAGGQHINTTDSAVRLTHMPTGIIVACQAERSQHKNRATAFKMLKARLYELELQKQQEKIDAANAKKTDIGWGHQIRSYVLQPYQLVKDLRTGNTSTNPSTVLDGDLDDFIQASLAHRIKGGGEAVEDID